MPELNNWLYLAEVDLKAARIILSSPEPLIHPVLYHAQQCAEKALKAFLLFHKVPPPRTHDLTSLVNKCAGFDGDFAQLSTIAAELTPYVVTARYPDDNFYLPDISIAEHAIKQAGLVLEIVKEKLGR